MIQKESRAPGSAICSATSPFRGSPQPRAAPDNDRCEIDAPGARPARARQDRLHTHRTDSVQARAPRRGPLPILQAPDRARHSALVHLQWRQTQMAFGLQLEQKTARRKILEPSACAAPLPALTQLLSDALATPVWMFVNPV